jgi:hypothetical protein
MKRECLLSRSYSGPPMIFNGREIIFSALANEILRELRTAFFTGDGDGQQTHHAGLCEGVLVMHLLAEGKRAELMELRGMTRDQRAARVLDFAIEHEEQIETIKPEIIARMEAAMAAMVESEQPGKPAMPAPASSPP